MIRSSRNVRPAQCGKLFSEPQISYSDNCVLKKKFRWVFFFPPSLQPTQPFTTSQLAREEAPLNSSGSAKHKLFIFPPRIVLTAPLNVLDGVGAVNVVKRDLLSPHLKKKKSSFFGLVVVEKERASQAVYLHRFLISPSIYGTLMA